MSGYFVCEIGARRLNRPDVRICRFKNMGETMSPAINRQLYLHQRPSGVPGQEHIRLREVPVPRVESGEVLLENIYLSMDPAIRGWMSEKVSYTAPLALGETIRGSTLGKVVDSGHPDFCVGDYAVGIACNGWEDYTLADATQIYKVDAEIDFPLSHYLSIYSAVGLTPYFGMLDVGRPRPGDTVLISAAAGTVGSLAGQIARIAGCKVVGIAGSDEKCRWLVDELGFDGAINYRSNLDLTAAIAAACPNGVDIFFDNVGGAILDAALMNLNNFARVVFCGAIAQYNTEAPVPGPYNYWQILARNVTVQGFLALNYRDRFPEAIQKIEAWIAAGDLVFHEDVVEGLENTVSVFSRLFSGQHKGKLLVKIR